MQFRSNAATRVWGFLAAVIWAGSSAAATPPPAPEDAALVDQLVKQWAAAPVADRDGGEAALQLQVPTRAFPLLVAAINERKDLPEGGRTWLKQVVERERPFVEARLRAEAQTAPHNEWNVRSALDAYAKVGHKDPRWDAAVRDGTRLALTLGSDPTSAMEQLGQAVAAGCDDPLVAYLQAMLLQGAGRSEEADARYHEMTGPMIASGYPASRKALALLRAFEARHGYQMARLAAGQPVPDGFTAQLDEMMKGFMDAWPGMVTEAGVPEFDLDSVATRIVTLAIQPGMDRKPIFDWVYPPLEKGMPATSALPALIKGRYLIKYAWDARGGGYANTVTPQGWQQFRDRLAEARKALERAWELDPTRAPIADEMLMVAVGADWPRPQMEAWFERAMKADPNDFKACSTKLYYLEPKWHGSPEAMLAFGHECLRTHNWLGAIPSILAGAHEQLAAYAQDTAAYWRSPAVWRDLRAVAEPRLKARPTDAALRSQYCAAACRSEQWAEAARQFQLLGDAAVPAMFGGAEAMERARAQAAEHGATR